ncbi:MAG: imidazolonepropionase [Candidatus Limnocylindria bacterium]
MGLGKEADLVIRGARLLTLAPVGEERPRVGHAAADIGAVRDGWIASLGGTIVETGSGPSWERIDLRKGGVTVDAGGRVVMPGLIDPHTHLCYAGERWDEFAARRSGSDYLATLERGGGIHATVRATRAATDETLLGLMRSRLDRAIASGTTTIEVKSGYGLEPEEELRHLRLIAKLRAESLIDVSVTYLAAHALPGRAAADRAAFLRAVRVALETVVRERLAESVDAFVEKGVFEAAEVEPLMREAASLGLAVTVHADQLNDMGGAALAARLDARSADHVSRASTEGLRAMERARVVAVLLPGSALFVGYEPPDARRFVANRVAMALGTDHNPGTSPLDGMPTAIALGVSLCGLSPHEAIVAATANAAHALGRGKRTGALVAGRRADLVVLDTDDERELAYRLGARLVREVYANGARVAQTEFIR